MIVIIKMKYNDMLKMKDHLYQFSYSYYLHSDNELKITSKGCPSF